LQKKIVQNQPNEVRYCLICYQAGLGFVLLEIKLGMGWGTYILEFMICWIDFITPRASGHEHMGQSLVADETIFNFKNEN
jgi:hypothetical protein